MSNRLSAIVVALTLAAIAGAGIFALYDRSARSDRLAESRALKARSAELVARSLDQSSPLACLTGDLGDAVETACERVVFAGPETSGAAVAYTAARLSLIADGLDYARRSEPAFADTLIGVRRAIELDRFGLAAQVLSTRDGCTTENCAFFALTRDPGVLKANIKAHAYETYVARYAASWNAEERAAPPGDKPADPAGVPQASAPAAGPVPLASKYDFPSSASIPPVSIMNAEPPLPAKPDAKAPAAAEGAAIKPPPLPAKRPQTEAAAPQLPAAR